MSLNPKQVANFKKAYSDIPKNDWVDAWIIADNLRFGRITKEGLHGRLQDMMLCKTLHAPVFFAVRTLSREKARFMNYCS
jgi:hypothetical protein